MLLSIRRSIDIGVSPWHGMWMFVPVANLLAIALWAMLPSRLFGASTDEEIEAETRQLSRYRATMQSCGLPVLPLQRPSGVAAAVLGITAGVGYLVLLVVLSVYVLGSYGSALFFGAPVVTGAVAAYCLNRASPTTFGATLLHSTVTMLVASCGFLLIGLEGAICIAMATPIVLPLGFLGALVGRSIAVIAFENRVPTDRGLLSCLAVLPLLAVLETKFQASPTFEVCSGVVIAAPIDVVWHNVIDFPEIKSRPAWYFRFGIAYPQRARIEGLGVGAIRYCEFSTGIFKEPITVWDEPRRLAFDVTDQPKPMFELTPYRHIHPPHLDGAFRSLRGEFRLTALDFQHTRLEGSTWYKLDIRPSGYWTIWTDWIVHRIHFRVLDHIRGICET